jgi:hypothetical protein
MSKHKSQTVAESRSDALDDREGVGTLRALEVAVLHERDRGVRRT